MQTASSQTIPVDLALDPADQHDKDIFLDHLQRFQTSTVASPVNRVIGNATSPYITYMRAAWCWIIERSNKDQRTIYLYGAGDHSRWWLSIIEDLSKERLVGFIDDNPSNDQWCGYPVVSSKQVQIESNAMIVISSDRFEANIYDHARSVFGNHVDIIRPYENLPPGPYLRPVSAQDFARRVDATCAARERWGGSSFVGPYERAGYVTGFLEEQWLWTHRDSILGRVMDMSTPRYWHQWVYDLPAVTDVAISDLDRDVVDKDQYTSPVIIRGDFCADCPPVAPDSFDTVLCLSILEHCSEPVKMLTNLRYALADGGTLMLAAPFAYIDGHCRPDYWRFGRDGMTLLAQQAGFRQVSTGTLGDVGPMLESALGIPLAANQQHDGIPLLTWMIAKA